MTQDILIKKLIEKGVRIHSPQSVEIGGDVDIDRISGNGVILHSGSRIYGKSTYISDGCVIGSEGPATVDDCWLGPSVAFKSGYINRSVFLKKAGIGYGSHIREGSILEEESSTAHTVGLKQTILFPFVTLGSLINFCDCLMAGGTSRKDHSEVGSSYIHFNYTPSQDKATPSLLGDVPKGVMLNNSPIFLGGQGGLVGPCRLNFGTVIAAGTIQRKDELEPNRLLFGGTLQQGNIKHTPGYFQFSRKILQHNIHYISNLVALMSWYTHVRTRCISDSLPEPVVDGLIVTLNRAIGERLKRLKDYTGKAKSTMSSGEINDRWVKIESDVHNLCRPETDLIPEKRFLFLNTLDAHLQNHPNGDYIELIKRLDPQTVHNGTEWLSGIVETAYTMILQTMPECK
jgi:UDP-N-acetylglucosamine/UDP-N-acetylgalactosamine diphosphorylase